MCSHRFARFCGSSPVDGSSRNSSDGACTRPIATSSRRRCPPDRLDTLRSRSSVRSSASSSSPVRVRACRPVQAVDHALGAQLVARRAGCARRRCPGRRSRSAAGPAPARRPRRDPATVAVPEVGAISVVSMRIVVVLPAPFGPSTATSSPGSTSRSMPRTAWHGARAAAHHEVLGECSGANHALLLDDGCGVRRRQASRSSGQLLSATAGILSSWPKPRPGCFACCRCCRPAATGPGTPSPTGSRSARARSAATSTGCAISATRSAPPAGPTAATGSTRAPSCRRCCSTTSRRSPSRWRCRRRRPRWPASRRPRCARWPRSAR